jgi:hypothetical protein
MKERKTITKALAEQYRRAKKKQKGQILEQLVEATGYNRHYAAWVLRWHGKRVEFKPKVVLEGSARPRDRSGRKPTYAPEVLPALKKVWEMLDYPTGKRLAPILKEVVPHLVAHRELRINKSLQKQLLAMSAATIDRLLKPERQKHTIKGRATTKPGTLLKHQIPIRTFSDWDNRVPGFLEMDLVGHDGGNTHGDYCFTLDMTDVATGWTELAAVPNKAQTWVFEALQGLQRRLPFAVLGVDSDNGSEFINNHLFAYCTQQQITFTRSRPYQKNDTCYVEQKNWSIVRRFTGYSRYDTPAACSLLNDLYRLLSDYINFFLPSMKLQEKTRDGARVRKRYDTAQTPYQRILHSDKVPKTVKERLKRRYEKLNLAALHRQIRKLQRQLDKVARRPTPLENVA